MNVSTTFLNDFFYFFFLRRFYIFIEVWLCCGIVVSWLREGAFCGLRVGLPVISLSGNNLGQVVCARATVTKQYNLVPVKGR